MPTIPSDTSGSKNNTQETQQQPSDQDRYVQEPIDLNGQKLSYPMVS